ncbi:arf-GAP with Rho-GAP domain, ANK repeat and PH domain-containing protein 1 isoform X1 [Dermacentor andersoni]|uniref:arf-GAP with Rho-GAP domain, ANK repeat and PH domain-containing protein 1 isoform X1 n=1 Tax=Dermacentor andersoni TaxID=34620 RepID=UPI002155166B|nr:arf-GAP with Rho-GAP domain, ANK repeat and PH domain-containing protein 1-like isoform X1 [Dermacentor andersoni]
MNNPPPILPRRPQPLPPSSTDQGISPPISLDTKVPCRSLSFKAPKKDMESSEPSSLRYAPDSSLSASEVVLEPSSAQPCSSHIQKPMAQHFTNPIYLLMDDKMEAPARVEQAPRANRVPDVSDTDSIMFLKKNRPKLQRQKCEEAPSSPQLPPSLFPHIYEDVPQGVLEKNRKLIADQEARGPSTAESLPECSSAKDESSRTPPVTPQGSPQEFVKPIRDVSVFWNQPQLSLSGVFYEFPVHRSPPNKQEMVSPTYDTPPSLRKQISLTDTEYESVVFKTPPSYEIPPPPLPVTCDSSISKESKLLEEDDPKSPVAACTMQEDSLLSSSAHMLYEVPKPFPRPCISPPENAFVFPDSSELYDIPPQRAAFPSLSDSPRDSDFMDAFDVFSSDDIESEYVPLITPPPSYPPPPPPEPEPPEIPPRNNTAVVLPEAKCLLEPQVPIPAVRTSLAKRNQVDQQPGCSTPLSNSVDEEKASSHIKTASTFYWALLPSQHPAPVSFKADFEQSPTPSLRSASLNASPSVPDSPQFESPLGRRAFTDMSDRCPSRQDTTSATSDSSSLQSEDCWTTDKLDFSGYVYKAGSNRKGFQKCWCTLNDGCWSYYASDKDTIPLGALAPQDIGAVFAVAGNEPSPATSTVPNLWCFEIQALQSQNRPLLLGVPTLPERREWLERLAHLVAPQTSSGLSARQLHGEPKHAGRLHLKEGTTGFWQTAGVVLRGRSLGVHLPGNVEQIDLRKVMSVGKVTADQTYLTYGGAQERGPSFQVRIPGRVLYLQADHPKHTESWLASVTAAWQTPLDAPLSEQYVTPEGIPVAVDRCINFISTHGTLLTGIYRLAGSSAKIKKLVEHMLQNPWDLHLTTEEYSPHDVSNALKRYLRSFKDCLLTSCLFSNWIQSSKCQNPDERKKMVKNLLSELPTVNYLLLKKLASHLKSISDHSDKNFMPVLNLAPVFGPSVLYKMVGDLENESSTSSSFEENNASMDVVADLISGYSWFFEVDAAEMEKEKRIQAAMDLLREAKIAQRPAGDILVGVYVYSKDWGHCINVKLSPAMTAGALCKHTMQQLNIKEPVNKMAVFEVVCDQDLERPLHHSEPVLSVVVRWANWDASFAKSNYLCIKNNYVYDEIAPLVSNRQPLSVFSELRYAEARQKSFKKSVLEFTGGKITQYKDSKASQLVNQWNIEDVLWFMGCESRRSPPSKWNFTFVMRQGDIKRTRDRPFFGNCVSLATQEEFEKWLAAMLNAEFPKGIFPPPPEPIPDLLS